MRLNQSKYKLSLRAGRLLFDYMCVLGFSTIRREIFRENEQKTDDSIVHSTTK